MTTATTSSNLLDKILMLNHELELQEAKLKEAEKFADAVLLDVDVPEADLIDAEVEELEKILDDDLGALIQGSIADHEEVA